MCHFIVTHPFFYLDDFLSINIKVQLDNLYTQLQAYKDASNTLTSAKSSLENDVDIDPVKVEEYTAILESSIDLDSIAGTYCGVCSYIQ